MRQVFITAILLFSMWSTSICAEVKIVITQGVDTARPIVVLPFIWQGSGAPPEDIGGIIAADLRNSGKFNPIDTTRIPEQPTRVSEVTPDAWTALGIDALILGHIQPSADGGYVVSYHMVDLTAHSISILSHNEYKVTKKWLRYSAHASSDEVFEKLTGIKGAFCTRIAYIAQNNFDQLAYELRISDYDGHNQFVVHRSPQPLMSPTWSADGTKLAYVTFESGKSVLVIQNLSDGSIRHIASFPCHNGAPSFSPDGKKLAFALSKTGSLNLYIMDLGSEKISQITHDHSNNTEPSWFPDSQTIAFTSDQTGVPQIYKINIYSGSSERITWQGSKNQDADVSHDGKYVFIVSTSEGLQHITKLDLSLDTHQVLTDTFLDETPSIAPNGTMVVYSATEEVGSVLWIVSTDGRFKLHFPATDSQVKFPAWSPYL
ncbi:Tol-Pal system beta propeller repeat protein TolB [Candidatus Profftia tarda]|uniref:Tol-Pal system protein TolB n=1 Tax=Candidatus Profftia tarda TaxID=1177216 RepID=A0A8E4EYD0_9ENTR|nr:Tol-Pal system beta propeller repeat protein TolB [Candidatus Profftia tarda]CAD6509925.1 Protein TolB [Candidatus Profftia tarda]